MTGREIVKEIESWAPKEIAWQKDNVGLQVGSLDRKLKNILLSLDLTQKVIDEAVKKGCNLIITHHPLLFHPVKKIDLVRDKNSMFIEQLIKNDITLFAAHTNLDNTKDGFSFILAKTLNLVNISFLSNLKSTQYKLSVFVPVSFVEQAASAAFKAGAGIIGEYSEVSFRTAGKGTFRGSKNSNPSIGNKEEFVKTDEVKLELLVHSWKVNDVITAINKVHPYEEAAYDMIPVDNDDSNFGAGAVGELEAPMNSNSFIEHVCRSLKTSSLRHSKGKNQPIKKVAVCGGSGIEYLNNAIAAGADAFVTADVKYHSFQDAEGKILLIDAGHYETEAPVLNEVKKRLEKAAVKSKIKIYKFSGTTNPVIFYNN